LRPFQNIKQLAINEDKVLALAQAGDIFVLPAKNVRPVPSPSSFKFWDTGDTGDAVELKPRHPLSRGERSVLLPLTHIRLALTNLLVSSPFPLENITSLRLLPTDERSRILFLTKQIIMASSAYDTWNSPREVSHILSTSFPIQSKTPTPCLVPEVGCRPLDRRYPP
jgi:hypothetical protein